jgi:sugar lactone lactonase YvrE
VLGRARGHLLAVLTMGHHLPQIALTLPRSMLPVVLCLAALGCSERERTNPLDPVNLAQSPDPWAVEAVADDGLVTLRWQFLEYDDLSTVVIERRLGTAPDSVAATFRLPLASVGLVDAPLPNDIEVIYHFLPELDDGRIVAPVGPLPATPGSARCWVANTGSLGSPVVRVAPDGRVIAERLSGFRSPNDIDVASITGQIWVADSGNGRVVALAADGEQLVSVSGFRRPKAVSSLPDGAVWVADEGSFQSDGALVLLAADGGERLRIDGFSRPADVAARASDESVWLSDRGTGILWRFSAAGDTLARVEDPQRYASPLQLAIVESDGSLWLTDDVFEAAAHLAADGSELARLSLSPHRPFGIVVVPESGAVWIGLYRSGRVERYSSAGTLELGVDGFIAPRGLALDDSDHTLWVADQTQVVTVSDDGSVLARAAGVVEPFALAVDAGVR